MQSRIPKQGQCCVTPMRATPPVDNITGMCRTR